MRTTLDLPDALVQEALQVTRIKTKKQLVTRALEELIKRERLSELKQYQGKIDLNIDLDVLRDRARRSCRYVHLDRLFQEW